MAAMATMRRVDRLERLTNLVLVLLDTARPLPLREIALTVAGYPVNKDACRQAFERDKRALRNLGIPITVAPISGEEQIGYQILPEAYYLPELGLTAAERDTLAFAAAAVRLEGGPGRDALAKLGAPDLPELAPIAVLPSLPALGPLREAIRDRSIVTFGYHGRDRHVAPHCLTFRWGSWYLVGLDVDIEEQRTFRIDRLDSPPKLGRPGGFVAPDRFDAVGAVSYLPWRSGGRRGEDQTGPGLPIEPGPEAIEVELLVGAGEARAVVGLVGARAVTERLVDGSVRLRFPIGDESTFVAFVVGLGDAAELVGPSTLREQVIETLLDCLRGWVTTRRRHEQGAALIGGGPGGPTRALMATAAPPRQPRAGESSGRTPRVPALDAASRLHRLLALLAYLAVVGEERIVALAKRFSMSEAEVVSELELAACCGLPPYTPDTLVELLIDDERVVAEGLGRLARPARLTATEGVAIAAAARALLAVPGADEGGVLASALAKLDRAIGGAEIAVALEHPDGLDEIERATRERAQVSLDYVSGNGSRRWRTVDPLQTVVREGRWYLDGYCHLAGGIRRFAVDRIVAVRPTGAKVAAPDEVPSELTGSAAFVPGASATEVVVRAPERRGASLERVATGPLTRCGAAMVQANVLVGSPEWLGRLLLLLGPQAELEAPASLRRAGERAAARALQQYGVKIGNNMK
jgi:predicted DNA-binding transcriptional regulator YafY